MDNKWLSRSQTKQKECLCEMNDGISNAIFVFIFAVIFALIEIEVEGTNGWAKNLPTTKNIVGHLTLYHVYMVLLAIFIIAGFLFYKQSKNCKGPPEKKNTSKQSRVFNKYVQPILIIIFHIVLYFLIQDFLWFVFNPGFKVTGYHPSNIPWHKYWFGGLPIFNYIGLAVVLVLLCATYFDFSLVTSIATYVLLVAAACLLSPLYHLFYNSIH